MARREYFFNGDFARVRKSKHVELYKKKVAVKQISIPVKNLVHITHAAKAAQIEKATGYEFKPGPKVVRSGKEKTMKVHKDDKLDPIDGGQLFPGFYSWWSVYSPPLDSTDIIPDYLKNESSTGEMVLYAIFKLFSLNMLSHVRLRNLLEMFASEWVGFCCTSVRYVMF